MEVDPLNGGRSTRCVIFWGDSCALLEEGVQRIFDVDISPPQERASQ